MAGTSEVCATGIDPGKLRGLGWAALERKALDAGVTLGKVQTAATREELRVLIVEAATEGEKANA